MKNLYVYVDVYICIYGIHTTERFLEVARESWPWPEWGFEPTTTEFR